MIAAVLPPGTPIAISGTSVPEVTPLLAASGAATPSGTPVPKASGFLEKVRACW